MPLSLRIAYLRSLSLVGPLAVLLLGAATLTAGCGAAFEPSDLGAVPTTNAEQPLGGDLVPADGTDGALVQAPGDPGSTGAPKVFYVKFSDGKALPKTNPNPCPGTPPKFVCDFAPTLAECQRQIQAYLDRWYADFNLIFTFTRPTSGAFYTEVVSSGGGAWCNAADNVAGIAPFLCDDLAGGVAYTFDGGKDPKDTAIIIAQEQAHLVGLEHTLSTHDVMDPTVCPNCDGFENVNNKIQNDQCGRTRQNSYQMMLDRLGAWTGGIKPTPLGCQMDSGPPLVQFIEPTDNATVADSFLLRVQASDDCMVDHVTVNVSPMGLNAQSAAAPFEWTLTRISGRQTITVTAFDPSGKQSSSSITVTAPGGTALGGAGGTGAGGAGGENLSGQADPSPQAGCDVGGCDLTGGGASGGTGLWVSLVLALAMGASILWTRRRASPARAPRCRQARQARLSRRRRS